MVCKLVALSLLVAVAIAAPQSGYDYNSPQQPSSLYQQPTRPTTPRPRPPTQLYNTPQASNVAPSAVRPQSYNPPAPMEGMPYDFEWGVQDQDSGNAFSHVENSDGQTTQGEYRVLLPDGRTQVVRFYDNGDGFNAEVTYE
ncbi:pro-resilin-like [Penaeus japonicus]|uniref:pro-resilin-like n=1 Tax=Penaeus japonicus TaxID=27405 RepID=UPI001C70D2AF|nr:pro-resilin-like [Penaeus japonicus]